MGNESTTVSSLMVPLVHLTVFKCIYFFAGPARKGDLKFWLQEICEEKHIVLQMHEFDLLRGGPGNDLSILGVQQHWINRLEEFNAVVVTPPCSTFSRAPWANSMGPVPVRSARYPDGFPWLSNQLRSKAVLGNSLVQFHWDCLQRVHQLQNHLNITGFGEHPEDLGRVRGKGPGDIPASIWRSQQYRSLMDNNWWSAGFKQDALGAPTAKPTRAISNSWEFEAFGTSGPPTFDVDGFYTGPILRSLDVPKVSLLRKKGDTGPFRTAQALSLIHI